MPIIRYVYLLNHSALESGDEWERQFEGRKVPEEYKIMSYHLP